MFLDEMPVNPTGKLDRVGLKRMAEEHLHPHGLPVRPGLLDSPPRGGWTITRWTTPSCRSACSPGRARCRSRRCAPTTRRASWCPARVDPRTGYRTYTVDQLADAAVIVRLRALDLPSTGAGGARSPRPRAHPAVLGAPSVAMQERLAETERIVAELQSGDGADHPHPGARAHRGGAHTVRMRGHGGRRPVCGWLGLRAARRPADGASRTGPPGALYRRRSPTRAPRRSRRSSRSSTPDGAARTAPRCGRR